MLHLKRPLASFDIEGTGLDLEQDRMVELSIQRIPADPAQKVEWFIQRFNPGRPMSKEAAKVTGIQDADLAGCPPFADVAAYVLEFLDGCDLLGYNLFQYDIPILQKEFQRCGLTLSLDGRAMVDAGNIFKKKEERTLAAALKFYCGREHDSAHTAAGDVQATTDVFFQQLERYQDLAGMTLEEVGMFSRFGVDLAGKFGKDDDGDYVYNFKNRGQKVKEDTGLARWMLSKDFTPDTKAWARRILQEIREEEDRAMECQGADAAPFGLPY